MWHHLSEAEIQANRVYSTSPSEDPPKPQSQSIGAMKKKKSTYLVVHYGTYGAGIPVRGVKPSVDGRKISM